jgi:hypothetical protein
LAAGFVGTAFIEIAVATSDMMTRLDGDRHRDCADIAQMAGDEDLNDTYSRRDAFEYDI